MAFIQPHYSNRDKAWAHASNILWRTTDGGVSWSVWADGFTGIKVGSGLNPIGFDISNPQRFAMGVADTTCITTANMTSYTQRPADEAFTGGDTPSCLCMGIEPSASSNILIACLGRTNGVGAVIRSTDYGANWTQILADSKQYTLFWDKTDTNFVYAGSQRSQNKWASWSSAGNMVCGLSADGLTVWGIGLGTSDTTIYKATNGHTSGSLTWSTVTTFGYRMFGGGSGIMGLQYFPPFAAHPTTTTRFYTINSVGEIIRVDGTTITTPANGPLTQAGGRDPVSGLNIKNGVVNICIDPQHPEIVYAFLKCTGLSWCYRSTDDGATWTDITENIPLHGANASAGQVVHPLTGEVMIGYYLGTRVRHPPSGFSYSNSPISVAAELKNRH
jgi:hypothetical protein